MEKENEPVIATAVRRRRFQFSLRAMFICLTVLAVALGAWVGPAIRQRDSVLALERLGGVISYDFNPYYPEGSPWRRWLSTSLGNDFVGNVVSVWMRPDRATWERKFVGRYKGRIPHTDGPMITDEDMRVIANLNGLEVLVLSKTEIGDVGIRHLSERPSTSLRDVSLDQTNVTDAALVPLSGFRGLRHLDLRGTAVSKAAIMRFKKSIPECEVLTGDVWPPESVQAF